MPRQPVSAGYDDFVDRRSDQGRASAHWDKSSGSRQEGGHHPEGVERFRIRKTAGHRESEREAPPGLRGKGNPIHRGECRSQPARGDRSSVEAVEAEFGDKDHLARGRAFAERSPVRRIRCSFIALRIPRFAQVATGRDQPLLRLPARLVAAGCPIALWKRKRVLVASISRCRPPFEPRHRRRFDCSKVDIRT